MLAAKARGEALAQAARDRVAETPLHDLHAVLTDVRVVADDCATRGTVHVRRDTLAVEGAPALGARAEGHVLAEDVAARDGTTLACAGAVVTPALARALDDAGVAALRVRDVRRCEATGGVCARCVGRDPDDATIPVVGDAVGARAAFAIARAARTFHRDVFFICSSGGIWPHDAARDAVRTTGGGTVHGEGLAWASLAERGDAPARVCLAGGRGEVRRGAFVMESYRVRAGDVLVAEEGATVRGRRAVPPSARGRPGAAGAAPGGRRRDGVLERGAGRRGCGRANGPLAAGVLPGPRRRDADPRRRGGPRARAAPAAALHRAAGHSGTLGRRGDALATLLLEAERFDLRRGTGWLRDHLDARPPEASYAAVIAPCDGRVEAYEAQRLVLRADDGRTLSVRRRRSKHLIVREGYLVRAGDALSDGARSHHRLLRVWGAARLADHMVDELAQEASLQPARVAEAWWSLAVRAMLAWRRVVASGDTGLQRNAVIARDAFKRAQRETTARGGT